MIITRAINILADEIMLRNRIMIGFMVLLFGIVIIFAIRALMRRTPSE